MSDSSTTAHSKEDRLAEIVQEFFEAGEGSDWRVLLDRHPDLADEIEQFFRNHADLRHWTAPADADEAATPTRVGGSIGGAMAAPPSLMGDYEILEEIGRGGMGVIYRARQKSLQRIVAIKMLLGWSDPEQLQRFRTEVEAVASLDHPHIVPIHDVGEHEGRLFFSMKFIEGPSLAARRKEYQRDPRAAARLVATIARAVQHAHVRGILHRDLKPGNILLGEMREEGGGMRNESIEHLRPSPGCSSSLIPHPSSLIPHPSCPTSPISDWPND